MTSLCTATLYSNSIDYNNICKCSRLVYILPDKSEFFPPGNPAQTQIAVRDVRVGPKLGQISPK